MGSSNSQLQAMLQGSLLWKEHSEQILGGKAMINNTELRDSSWRIYFVSIEDDIFACIYIEK